MIIDIYTHIFPDAFFRRDVARLAQAREHRRAAARREASCSTSICASPRWTRSATTARSSRCPIRRWRRSRKASGPPSGARRQRRDGGVVRASHPGPVSGVRRGGRRWTTSTSALTEAERAIKTSARAVSRSSPTSPASRSTRRVSRPVFAATPSTTCRCGCIRRARPTMPDYASEAKSRFEMWWCFGWPYETTVAMARLVFAGVFDRHPAEDRHASSRRRHDPVLRRAHRRRHGGARAAPRMRTTRKVLRRSSGRTSNTSASSTPTPRCSAAATGCLRARLLRCRPRGVRNRRAARADPGAREGAGGLSARTKPPPRCSGENHAEQRREIIEHGVVIGEHRFFEGRPDSRSCHFARGDRARG